MKERAQSDQFLHIIFEMCKYKNDSKRDKYYYDWSTGELMKSEELSDS
jgi:hypothetical protein